MTFACFGSEVPGPYVVVELRPRRIRIDDIQRMVALYYDIPEEEMISDRRHREVARPRQIAMYLAAQLTEKSLSDIGRAFRRDHTTVIHAIRQVTKLREADDDLDADVRFLKREIVA